MARRKYILCDDLRFALDQHAELNFYRASSLNKKSSSRHIRQLRHINWSMVTIIPPMRCLIGYICVEVQQINTGTNIILNIC